MNILPRFKRTNKLFRKALESFHEYQFIGKWNLLNHSIIKISM